MSSDPKLQGKVALVTGASRGIGRAIAERLARSGAAVACIATSAANAEATAEACRALGVEARAYGVDVSDTDAVAANVKEVMDDLGGLDVLVNNAGITKDQILMRMSEDDFDAVVAVNLKGTWNYVKAATRPLMKSAGRIVNISSVVGVTGNAGQVNYAASKAGVFGLTRSVAKELAGRKVTCNAIAPGFIETDMTAALDDATQAEYQRAIPAGRYGSPEEIAGVVRWIASDEAAYISGAVIPVDGGLGMGH